VGRALITGVTGQDGQHLSALLLEKGYTVFGLVRNPDSVRAHNFTLEFPEVQLLQGDMSDTKSLIRCLQLSKPDEIYNLAAQSLVSLSYKQPEATANVTGLGPLRLLEAVRITGFEHSRVYQASSSEMFGRTQEVPQVETTPFDPISPYGTAKVFAHNTCVNLREAYGLWVSCGILFNHEGPRRGLDFVTRKISSGAARIALGLQDTITLGSLDSRRDWGYAGDYVNAMWLMLQQDVPRDFVVATGISHSVKEFVCAALKSAGLDEDIEKFVRSDPSLVRPSEGGHLIGDSSLASRELGWRTTMTFDNLVCAMVEHDLRIAFAETRGE